MMRLPSIKVPSDATCNKNKRLLVFHLKSEKNKSNSFFILETMGISQKLKSMIILQIYKFVRLKQSTKLRNGRLKIKKASNLDIQNRPIMIPYKT